MDLQKFGIKLYFQQNGSYPSRDFIPDLHLLIQNDSIPEHMLIDVVDYSHISDGPGVMLIGYEGYFSLDQENNRPGILYMRKTDLKGTFEDRFNKVLSITIHAAHLLCNNNIEKELNISQNLFRFISNDRLLADNIDSNQQLYTNTINKLFKANYPELKLEFDNYAQGKARLAFDVNIRYDTNILKYKT